MILIVDDIPANLVALRKVLELHGLAVESAESGEEALLKTLKYDYSLIILDVQMPGMDGFEVAESLAGSSRTRDIPILFLSAVSKEKRFISRGYESGGVDYITKPVDPDLLILKVKTFLKLFNQQQELKDIRDKLSTEIEIRKKAQEELAYQIEEFRSVISSLPEVAFALTEDGSIELVNDYWYEYSKSASEFPEIHPDDSSIFDSWKERIHHGEVFEAEIRMRNLRTGKFTFFIMKVVPVKNNNTISRWVGTFTNIQRQKLANELLEVEVGKRTRELIDKNEELEFRNHELQQFAWVVSHDLKEPVRKIEIFTKMIQEQYLPDDSKAQHYSERTLSAAQRMSKLISDLLEYSRLSADALHQKVDLDEVVSEVLDDLDFQINEKQATIHLSPLPKVDGISSQLRQVFQNLVSNALKFSRKGVDPVITISAERILNKDFDSPASETGDYCKITFSDNGIGFNEKYLDRIFIIFQSLNDKKSFDGTGIGLAIAKKIIEKHSGLITARSTEGEGSTFIIILPIHSSNISQLYEHEI
ncbi:MAG: response regulator [Flavobacterium sp.]|nr:response regulator [Flavobacterium sp.]